MGGHPVAGAAVIVGCMQRQQADPHQRIAVAFFGKQLAQGLEIAKPGTHARPGMMDAERQYFSGMTERELLRDMTALRKPHHMRRGDAFGVQYSGRIVRHVGEAVGVIRYDGAPDAPIVGGQDGESRREERQLSGPEVAVMSRAGQQDQRRAVAVSFIIDADARGRFRWWACQRTSYIPDRRTGLAAIPCRCARCTAG